MMLPEETPSIDKPQPSPPVNEKRFISVTTDAIMDEYMSYKNHNLSLAERIRAGHRLLSTAAEELRKSDGVLADKIEAFVGMYVPPRIKIGIAKTTDDIPVYRIYIGGATESSIDVTMNDLQVGLRAVQDQMYEAYYNRTLSRVVGEVMVELARQGIVDEKPPRLVFSFSHLTAPMETEDDEEAIDGQE